MAGALSCRVSLLLLALFPTDPPPDPPPDPPGTGGASPVGLAMPGTGGAAPI